MGLSQRRRAAQQQRVKEIGFGGGYRTYAVTGVMGALGQLAWRSLVALAVFVMGALIVMRPPSAFFKFALVAAVLLALAGLRLVWRRVSADFGMNRCYLYPGGLVVTNLFGQVRDAAAWAEVTGLKRSYGAWLLSVFHRVELGRHGSAPLAFVALGAGPDLIKALQEQAARNGIPQHNIRFYVS